MGTPHGGLHQFECRWIPGKDMYPIASSEQPSSAVREWYGRLAGFVRPYPPGLDVPAASFVYTTFPDGTSAAIWRKWDQRAIPLGGESDRQSLVARVLFGHVTTLPPDTALALGVVGWPGIAGPVPGQVQPDDRLPAIAVDDLSPLITQARTELEAFTGELRGLQFLLAEALRDSTTPLSVLVPKRYMTKLIHEGPQAPMLWALLHTVRPLLDRQSDPGVATRAWTFSTYEPPLGRSDIRWLADIVFRADQQAPPPQITRNEITVRPWDPGQHRPPDGATQVAQLLDAAYRQIGGEQIAQFLARLAAEFPDLHDRLAVARHRLTAMVGERDFPADRGQTVTATAPPRSVPAASPAPEPRTAFGERAAGPALEEPAYAETAQETRSYAGPSYPDRIREEVAYRRDFEEEASLPGVSSFQDPADPGRLSWAQDVRSAAAAARPMGHPAVAGVPASGPPDNRHPGDPDGEHRTGVLDLLHRMFQNPEDPAFREAVTVLRRGDAPLPDPGERARARSALARRGWYLPILLRHDPQCVNPVLTTLFWLTVIPDLQVQGVADDVARWAGEFEAPPAVIRALVTAAAREGADCSRLLEDVLRGALSWRWLGEHGIRDETVAPAGTGERSPSHHRPPAGPEPDRARQFFAAEPRSGVVASPLAWLCLLQMVVLVVVLLRL